MQLFKDTGQIANLKQIMSHMQIKDNTNVRFSVHECVMETWHVQCSKNSKHTFFAFKADTCGNKNIVINIG